MHQEFKQGRFDGVKSVSKVTKRRSRSLFSRVAVVITSALSLLVAPVINAEGVSNSNAVSYTHLTLPTICSV